MKSRMLAAGWAGLVLSAAASLSAAVVSETIARGPHFKTVETSATVTNEQGQVSIQKHRYTLIEDGMHYQAVEGGPLLESDAAIVQHPNGAVCQSTPIRTIWANNLNSYGSIDSLSPDNQRLRSHPLSLHLFNRASGERVLIGQLQDSIGEVLPPDRIIYRDCFQGIQCDLLFSVGKGRVEADCLIRERPVLPVGWNPEDIRIELVTEYVEAPAPRITEHVQSREPAPRRAQMAEPDVVDQTLNFGLVRISLGRSFLIGEDPNNGPRVPVAKKWLPQDQGALLVESVGYTDVQARLETLPPAGQAALGPPARTPIQRASLPRPPEQRQFEPMQMAKATELGQGLVLDATTVYSTNAWTFSSGQTYLIVSNTTISASTVIQENSTLKFSLNTALTLSGAVTCPPGPSQAVLAAKYDHSIGELIDDGSGNYPPLSTNYYAATALHLYYVNNGAEIKNLQFRNAKSAIDDYSPDASHYVRNCRFITNQVGVGAYFTTITISNMATCSVVSNTHNYGSSTFYTDNVYTRCEPLVNKPSDDSGSPNARRQSESSLTVCGSAILVAFVDAAVVGKQTGYARSTDGGGTYTDKGSLPSGTEGNGVDPVVACETASSIIHHVTNPGTDKTRLRYFRSSDGGRNFDIIATSTPTGFQTGDNLDKPWIAVDNYSGTGQNNIYQVFINNDPQDTHRAGVYFNKSTSQGTNWSAPSTLNLDPTISGFVPFVTVGPSHEVYVFSYHKAWRTILGWKSTNQGGAFNDITDPSTLISTNSYGPDGAYFLNIKVSNSDATVIRNICSVQAAVNPISGHIYVVFPDRPSASSTDQSDIFFTKSTDGGTTWTARKRVNDDSTNNDQWNPVIAVKPNGTQLFIGFYDRRADSNNALRHAYGRIADISGVNVTFRSSFQVSASNFPVVYAPLEGDYDTASADNTYFYYAWGDNRDIIGGTTPLYEANIRFTKIYSP